MCVCVKFVAHLLSMFPVYISTRTRFSMGHKKINQEMKRKKKNALTRKRLKMNAAGVAEVLTFFLSKSITDDGRRFISRDIRHVNCFDDNNNNSKVSKGAVYGRKKSVWGGGTNRIPPYPDSNSPSHRTRYAYLRLNIKRRK